MDHMTMCKENDITHHDDGTENYHLSLKLLSEIL